MFEETEIPLPKETEPLPDLPSIANYYLRKDKLDDYVFAMSDILCWMGGFQAAGGSYTPCSIEVLRDLNIALKSIQAGQSKSGEGHE